MSMGFRFRKSINLGGGFKVNLSKSGIGYSWGTKGARITKTAKGTKRTTLNIPGTDISYVSETSGKKHSQGRTSQAQAIQSQPAINNSNKPQKKDNDQGGKKPGMKKIAKFSKNTVLWVLTVFFALTFLVYLPHIASFISLALAVVLAPITKWQNILGKFLKGKLKVLVAVVLFVLTFIAVPTNETTNSDIPPETVAVFAEETTDVAEETTIEATVAPTTEPPTEPTEPPTEPTEPPTEPTEPPTEPTEDEGWDYVLNTNTRKFHYPSCSSAKDIKASNRRDYHGTREDVIAMGYKPCGRCHP